MKYRVYLDSITDGIIDVEADTKDEAKQAALDDPGRVDWSDSPPTITICDVTTLDEMGDEID